MTQIRKEQKEFKLLIEEKERTIQWLEKNAVLIHEGFDRSILHRLNSSISRFDEKFGPYKTRLPAIAKVLQDAEKGLYVVITGGTSKKSAAHMLERMTLIYNILSNFFARDLQMLLKTPVFKTAVGMPDRALNMIEHPEHNHKMIKRVFIASLKPDRNEREVFDRVYKKIPMPTINWNEAAKQLMGLCVNDLHELCGIEKVPAVVVDNSSESTKQEESKTNPDVIMEIFRSIEERPQYQQLQRAITQLQQIAQENGLTSFNAAITSFSDELLNLISSEDFGTRASTFFSSLGGLIRANDPVQRLLAQGVKAVQTFATVRRVWNQNKEMFLNRARSRGAGATLTPAEKTAIEALLTRALERGGQIASGLRGLVAIEPYPGLEPETIRDAFMTIIENEVNRGGTAAGPNASRTFDISFEATETEVRGSPPADIPLVTADFNPPGKTITLPGSGSLERWTYVSGSSGPKKTWAFKGWQAAGGAGTTGTFERPGDPYTVSGTPRNIVFRAVWKSPTRPVP